ncbi:serine/threonine-protein kinase [Striga asiatica]|uniref:Receptor-like serine/threonine-protein kinase n=1 Tax=Striga asiatica TaxID=4170 RepID=A0A5A7P3Q6_STRAF|nr:serine/threonine-protein kinase [Striga asiatica]
MNSLFYNISLLSSILLSAVAINADEIPPGSTLYASNPQQSWVSPNRSFALSFIRTSDGRYSAAVTYNGFPIWKAGGDPGGAVNSSAELRFLPDGDLLLVAGPAEFPVWRSNTSGLGVTSASLEDTGNFILKNRRNLSVWSTFDNPTDTILPGQNFTANHVLSCGLYSFHLMRSGQIALRWNNTIVYYTSSGINTTTTSNLNLTSPSLTVQQGGIFSLSDPTLLTGPLIMARSNRYGEVSFFNFVKLDCDGNMRMYSSSGISEGLDVRWTAVSDQCEVFGYCGNFGICRYDDDETNSGPFCECPSANFDPIDPNDSRKGCRRKEDIRNCQPTILSLNNTLFMTLPPEIYTELYTANIAACSSNCLSDTTCQVSTSLADGSGVCYMKRSGFVSGYHSPTLTETSFVKVCGPVVLNSLRKRGSDKKSERLEIAVIVLVAGFVLFLLVGCFLWLYLRSKTGYDSLLSQHYSFSDYASGVPIQFSYKELHKGTKGFTEKLGSGGFGSVYKGLLLPNKTPIAVKKLEGIFGQGEKQFRMEVATISSTHHLNLVRLIGFCSEGKHRMLVYEFMKNGSLDSILFEKTSVVLSWQRRYNIALGTAKGLAYLHEECRDCILHCDIKPENILLDESFNARISDFGLARLDDERARRSLMTAVRGTRGYLAPEWIANLPINSKADVYSYGMVLLEIVSGRRNFEVSGETGGRRFWVWAYGEFEKGNVGSVLDGRVSEEEDADVAAQAERLR